MEYIAHVRKGGGSHHGLPEHLAGVSRLAAEFAAVFGAADPACLAAAWHDLGKYRPGFQRYIASCGDESAHLEICVTSRDKTHAAAGVRHAVERFGVA